MLKLTGKILNVFQTPAGQRQDGTKYGGDYNVQIQAESVLRNGENRIELVNLRTSSPEKFTGKSGKDIIVDVGAFARGNALVYFLPERFEVHEVKSKLAPAGLL